MKKVLVLLFAGLLMAAFAVPASAEVKVGGIVFLDVMMQSFDEENSGAIAMDANAKETKESVSQTLIQVPNITRLYAKWNDADNRTGAWLELGLDGNGVNERGVVVRQANAWFQVNEAFRLTVGQAETGFSPLSPSQMLSAENGNLNLIGLGFGNIYSGRVPQVRFDIKTSDALSFKATLSDPTLSCFNQDELKDLKKIVNDDDIAYMDGSATPKKIKQVAKVSTSMPRIDLSADIKAGPISIYPGVSFANKDYVGLDEKIYKDMSIGTTAFSLGFKGSFDSGFGFAAEYNSGTNLGNQDFHSVGGATVLKRLTIARMYNTGTDTAPVWNVSDTEITAYWADFSFKAGDAIAFHLIYGSQNVSNEMDPKKPTDDFEQTTTMMGLSVPIKATDSLTIRPEAFSYTLGEYEVGTTTTDKGGYMIFGVQFQLVF